jgi:hypothetical protein
MKFVCAIFSEYTLPYLRANSVSLHKLDNLTT